MILLLSVHEFGIGMIINPVFLRLIQESLSKPGRIYDDCVMMPMVILLYSEHRLFSIESALKRDHIRMKPVLRKAGLVGNAVFMQED